MDLETGQIVSANATIDLDFDSGEGRRRSKANGTIAINLFQIVFRNDPAKK